MDIAGANVLSHGLVPVRAAHGAKEARAVVLSQVSHALPGRDHCVALCAGVRRIAALDVS